MPYSQHLYRYLLNPRLSTIFILGFASGLPLALSGNTLQAWYTVAGVDITDIGLLSLVGIPYVFKFLWAPVLDKYIPITFLGRRRGWIFLSQFLIVLVLIFMAFQSPKENAVLLGFLALLLAFFSASQDIAFDAYRTDLMQAKERGLGAAFSVTGYRIAMLASGSVALMIAQFYSWQISFLLMAALMLLSMVISFKAPEPIYQEKQPASIRAAVIEPFREYMQRSEHRVLLLLIFIVLYKLGDAFAGNLTPAFLLRGAGFSLTDIALVTKTVGLGATLIGVFWGGIFLYKNGLFSSLLWFGVLQALTNLGFVILSFSGKNTFLMGGVIAMEHLAGGMGTAAFVAFLMGLCHHSYSATQYALFSALAAVGRVYIGPIAGYTVAWYGWSEFFIISVVVALPGLLLLLYLRQDIQALELDKTENNLEQQPS